MKKYTLFALAIFSAPTDLLAENGATYRERYPLSNATQKLVSNTGDGDERLYGTRNFRAVLNGVFYRGGANNAFLKPRARDNRNPLPQVGIDNLCEEGFGTAIYLYSTNFNTAPQATRCRTFDNADNTFSYKQISVLSGEAKVKEVLSIIHQHIRNPRLGPVYAHCWNGWHASGMAGGAALRQFCGFTGEQAARYWTQNIDGHEMGESVRNRLRAFQPYAEFQISAEERRAICPDTSSLAFP